MKDEYPDSKSDLFAAFIERCSKLTTLGGQLGFMTPYVWMFIKSYEPLRKLLLTEETITSLIQLEYSGFDGATVPICAFTFQHGSNPEYKGGYIRLADFVGPRVQAPKALEAIQDQTKTWFYRSTSRDFTAIPGTPIVYWLSEKMRAVFTSEKRLGSTASLAVGLQTGDNNRFLRQWWEVSTSRTAFSCTSREEAAASGARWFPYNKGGEFRKWYGNQEHVVNWENDGAEIRIFGTEDGGRPRSRAQNTDTYFSPSVSWSDISSGEAAFRRYPQGFIHDSTGHSGFGDPQVLDQITLLLNSKFVMEVMKVVAPTLHFHIGYVGLVPVAEGVRALPTDAVDLLIETAQDDWNSAETSWRFETNPLIALKSSSGDNLD